jgi:hypothetical protein
VKKAFVFVFLHRRIHVAFGARSSISGNLKPGEMIQLNFTKNMNAILIGL